jgi:hypothetical protein
LKFEDSKIGFMWMKLVYIVSTYGSLENYNKKPQKLGWFLYSLIRVPTKQNNDVGINKER